MSESGREPFEALVELLGHGDTAVRQAAIGALNSIGHPDMPARVKARLGHTEGGAHPSANAAEIILKMIQ